MLKGTSSQLVSVPQMTVSVGVLDVFMAIEQPLKNGH